MVELTGGNQLKWFALFWCNTAFKVIEAVWNDKSQSGVESPVFCALQTHYSHLQHLISLSSSWLLAIPQCADPRGPLGWGLSPQKENKVERNLTFNRLECIQRFVRKGMLIKSLMEKVLKALGYHFPWLRSWFSRLHHELCDSSVLPFISPEVLWLCSVCVCRR